jgi:hypothetical protein
LSDGQNLSGTAALGISEGIGQAKPAPHNHSWDRSKTIAGKQADNVPSSSKPQPFFLPRFSTAG